MENHGVESSFDEFSLGTDQEREHCDEERFKIFNLNHLRKIQTTYVKSKPLTFRDLVGFAKK